MLSLALYYPPLSLFGGFFLRINDKKNYTLLRENMKQHNTNLHTIVNEVKKVGEV